MLVVENSRILTDFLDFSEEVFFSLGARSVDGESELPDAELELPDGEVTAIYAGEVSVRGLYGYV